MLFFERRRGLGVFEGVGGGRGNMYKAVGMAGVQNNPHGLVLTIEHHGHHRCLVNRLM
jgi:hypothetical protein